MRCPRCNKRNPANAEYCISCQLPLVKKKKSTAKICPRCNKIYFKDVQYCLHCQCELVEKPQNPLKIIISITAVVIVAVISAFFFYPQYQFYSAIRHYDTQKLETVFKHHPDLLDSTKRKEDYQRFIDENTEKYLHGAVSYEQIHADFEIFSQINSHLLSQEIRDYTTEKQQETEKIHQSRLAFETAENSFENQDYQNAEICYTQVIPEDASCYSSAQEKLQEITEMKDTSLSSAQKAISSGNHQESIAILTEGINQFGYDKAYYPKFYEKLISEITEESSSLIQQNKFFSSQDGQGAFDLVCSYLNNERYAEDITLQQQMKQIAEASEFSEISSAESALGLKNRNAVIDACCLTATADYFDSPSIQDTNDYILTLCRNDSGVQRLISNIPEQHQVNVALISDIAVTAEEFSANCREKIQSYSKNVWDYTGIARYYSEEQKTFSWAVMIIYEAR